MAKILDLAGHSHSEPLREVILGNTAGGKALHTNNCISRLELQLKSIAGQKKPRNRPRGSFIAVDKPMIARKPEGVRGGEIRGIRRAVCK